MSEYYTPLRRHQKLGDAVRKLCSIFGSEFNESKGAVWYLLDICIKESLDNDDVKRADHFKAYRDQLNKLTSKSRRDRLP